MSKQVRRKRKSGSVPIVGLAVLLFAMVLTTLTQAAPLAQRSHLGIYEITLDPLDTKLCIGETQVFTVTVPLTITNRLHDLPDLIFYVAGEKITGKVINPQVGKLDVEYVYSSSMTGGVTRFNRNPNILRILRRAPAQSEPMQLHFIFTAEQKGATTIVFQHVQAAIDHPPALPTVARVDVVDCWEAYSSSLGKTWPTKDICSLDRPFRLEAADPPTASITGATHALFFWPSASANPNAPNTGKYVYVTEFTTTIEGLSSSCHTVSGGDYLVTIFDRTPKEGNIQLIGSITGWCHGPDIRTGETAGTFIAFRALPVGVGCTESLP